MIFCGVDPGLANCGVGVIQVGVGVVEKRSEKYEVLLHRNIVTSPYFSAKEKKEGKRDRPEGERFEKIANGFLSALDLFPNIAAVGIESLFITNRNKSSALKVAQVIGMIKYLCHVRKKPFYEFRPNDVKAAVGAHGGSKSDVIDGVEMMTGMRFKNSHVADAVAVAIAYSEYSK